jgi:hypothetical protein
VVAQILVDVLGSGLVQAAALAGVAVAEVEEEEAAVEVEVVSGVGVVAVVAMALVVAVVDLVVVLAVEGSVVMAPVSKAYLGKRGRVHQALTRKIVLCCVLLPVCLVFYRTCRCCGCVPCTVTERKS